MYRILYISTAREPLSQAELDAILIASRRNNAAVDVTGLLVVGGRRFLQVLEGPEDAVTATFERISRDPRHFAIVKLGEKQVEERSFGTWAMGFEKGADTAATTATLAEQVADLVAPITDANLRAYFTGFVKTHSSV